MHVHAGGVESPLHMIFNVSQFLHIIYLGILIRRGSPGLEGRVALFERGTGGTESFVGHSHEYMLLIQYKITVYQLLRVNLKISSINTI